VRGATAALELLETMHLTSGEARQYATDVFRARERRPACDARAPGRAARARNDALDQRACARRARGGVSGARQPRIAAIAGEVDAHELGGAARGGCGKQHPRDRVAAQRGRPAGSKLRPDLGELGARLGNLQRNVGGAGKRLERARSSLASSTRA